MGNSARIGRRPSRTRAAYLLRLVLNMIHHATTAYLVNKLTTETIHNDLGASFTTIYRKRGRVVKRAGPDGERKLRDEIEWILKFSKHPFGRFLPKVYDYSLEPGRVAYEMKYYTYPNLRGIIMTEMNARFFIRYRLRILMDALRELLWTEEQSCAVPPGYVELEHFAKYDQRRRMCIEMAPTFAQYMDPPTLVINGRRLLNADLVLAEIRSSPEMIAALTPERLYVSHGDVHCNNILCGISASRMVLLDCRGKSPAGTDYYDVAYDLGKLFHDFRSLYSLIERHSFSIFHEVEGGEVRVEYRFTDDRMKREFKGYFALVRSYARRTVEGRYGNALQRSDFTEAMLYLTMIPMHLRMKDEGLMCYVTGVQRLNEWIRRYRSERYEELCDRHGIAPKERLL